MQLQCILYSLLLNHKAVSNSKEFLHKINFLLRRQPPWIWLSQRGFLSRLGFLSLTLLPLESIQQFRQWLQRSLRPSPSINLVDSLPRSLVWRACWLNSYRPAELSMLWSAGLKSWQKVALQPPDNLSWALHGERRRNWPDGCRAALALLTDKAALLAATPDLWRAPFLLLQADRTPQDFTCQQLPAWWQRSLIREGLVLKPQRGHGGRHVIRFRATPSGLQAQALFGAPPDAAALQPLQDLPAPHQLLACWQLLCATREPAIAAPYLSHSRELPATSPVVVVRVITVRTAPEAPIHMHLAWLEVPLEEEAVALISLKGRALPKPGDPFSWQQQQSIQEWRELLERGVPRCVADCLEASRVMHGLLPPIDQVAWDWIPASPQPLLLEGNGGFGLLVPRLFQLANTAP